MKRSVNRLFDSQHPRRSCGRTLGLFLLVLPISGIAFQLSSVQAQPVPIAPAKKSPKPLSPEQKMVTDQVMAIARLENLCQSRIDLKLTNATLEDVTARVKQALPGQAVAIEVRGASPVRVGFELKEVGAGEVLQTVATLAGCKLFLLSGGLLIAPPSQLTGAESLEVKQKKGGEWAANVLTGERGWSNQSRAEKLLALAIAQEITGSDAKPQPAIVQKTNFGSFSPDSQAMLQQMATWTRESHRSILPDAPPFRLSADSPITVDTSDPKSIGITLSGGPSDPGVGKISTSINMQ
ncbi:hypothetical protein B1R32_12032 [Abditibacterium utsteinense]|uniref:Uncharacterized protein n=2 Tax=Abditibacterium utsteinense TaxID=1960156 RepID=A0A2S8SQ19_9BACT|nr:hypothetical protein B1R32_12032 [Abditibacterium utsteinense]